jgi:hypothetical protein
MFANSPRFAAVSLATVSAALLLSSCSGTVAVKAGSPDYYWVAARQAYAAGDYQGTVEQLDHLVDNPNEYTARAIPWSLVLTSGMASGYVELADSYARGALATPANSSSFRRKASEYRNLANPLVLQAVRLAEKLDQLPPGSITLTFGRPRGNLATSPVLYKIAAGLRVTDAEAETAPANAVESNVLASACLAVGAPNDSAKASDILSHASTITPRAAFAGAMAEMLDKTATLYDRRGLDLPDKLAMVQGRVKSLHDAAEQVGPAMVVKVNGQ